MRVLLRPVTLGVLIVASPAVVEERDANAFGLEEVLSGTSNHYELSKDSLWTGTNYDGTRTSSSWGATHSIAWLNDAFDIWVNTPTPYFDVYSFKADGSSNNGSASWANLHFDNVDTTAEAMNQWNRYIYGALYGLIYASERVPGGDFEMGAAVLGNLFHAIEDFHSHSNWVWGDAAGYARWGKNLLDYTAPQQSAMDLFTGNYDYSSWRPEHGGSTWDLIWSMASLADKCSNTGIHIDRLCSTRAGNRGFTGVDGRGDLQIFNEAKWQAKRATAEITRRLRAYMHNAGKGAYWESLMHSWGGSAPSGLESGFSTSPWPVQYYAKNAASRGDYPEGFLGGGHHKSGPGWHFRIQIHTRPNDGYFDNNGTDSNIDFRLHFGSTFQDRRLDRESYDDFVNNDNDAYYHGPYDQFPTGVALQNEGGDTLRGYLTVHAYYVGVDNHPAYYGKLVDYHYFTITNNTVDIPVDWSKISVNGTARVRTAGFGKQPADYRSIGGSALAVWRPSNGQWIASDIARATAPTSLPSKHWGLSGDKAYTGDFDGDGKADETIWRPSENRYYVWRSTSNTSQVYQVTPLPTILEGSRDVAVPGDYNGDGITDFVAWRPSDGVWRGTGIPGPIGWGQEGDVPLSGDFDGDGKDDIVIYRPSTGVWFRLLSSCNFGCYWENSYGGFAGDIPLVADFDGDEIADMGIYRANDPSPGAASFHYLRSGDGGVERIPYGLNTDIPVPADYDGDGKADIAVWRASSTAGQSGIHFRRSSGWNAFVAIGQPGDMPVLRRQGKDYPNPPQVTVIPNPCPNCPRFP